MQTFIGRIVAADRLRAYRRDAVSFKAGAAWEVPAHVMNRRFAPALSAPRGYAWPLHAGFAR
jgi:hypothetical protein